MALVFSQLILCPIFASNASMLFAIACIPASVWLSVDGYVIRKVQFSQTLLAHSILKLASYIPLFITKSMKMRKRKGKRMNEHGSCMCVAFLNASRAFDGVNITIRVCKMGSAFSDLFLVSNSVRQVNILIPIAVQ